MPNLRTRIWRGFLLLLSLGAILLATAGCCAPFADLFMGSGPAKGEPAPDFTLTSLEGKEVTLSEQRGPAVLIVFWSST